MPPGGTPVVVADSRQRALQSVVILLEGCEPPGSRTQLPLDPALRHDQVAVIVLEDLADLRVKDLEGARVLLDPVSRRERFLPVVVPRIQARARPREQLDQAVGDQQPVVPRDMEQPIHQRNRRAERQRRSIHPHPAAEEILGAVKIARLEAAVPGAFDKPVRTSLHGTAVMHDDDPGVGRNLGQPRQLWQRALLDEVDLPVRHCPVSAVDGLTSSHESNNKPRCRLVQLWIK